MKLRLLTLGIAVTLLAVGSLLAVALSVLMGAVLSSAIAKPVSAMTNAMGKLAAGDNDVDMPAVGRKDEVGRMASAVQHFKDAAIDKARVEAEASETRRAAESTRQQNDAERAATAAEQAKVVDGLAQGLLVGQRDTTFEHPPAELAVVGGPHRAEEGFEVRHGAVIVVRRPHRAP